MKNSYSPLIRILAAICLVLSIEETSLAQPRNNFTNFQENGTTYVPYTTGQSVGVGNNAFVRMAITNGGIYHWDVCGFTGYDTYLQGYNAAAASTNTTNGWLWYQDDNCSTASNSATATLS